MNDQDILDRVEAIEKAQGLIDKQAALNGLLSSKEGRR